MPYKGRRSLTHAYDLLMVRERGRGPKNEEALRTFWTDLYGAFLCGKTCEYARIFGFAALFRKLVQLNSIHVLRPFPSPNASGWTGSGPGSTGFIHPMLFGP